MYLLDYIILYWVVLCCVILDRDPFIAIAIVIVTVIFIMLCHLAIHLLCLCLYLIDAICRSLLTAE